MIIFNQSIGAMQNYATYTQVALSFILKLKMFMKTWQVMLKKKIDTSNYASKRPLPTGKNKKVIGLMKDELGGKITTEFVGLRPKTYSYSIDDGSNKTKTKGTRKWVIKRILKFNDYKNCLLNNEIILKLQQRFESETHNVYIEEIKKIALTSNGDKR